MRILIVDDTTFMRSTIRRILEKNNMRTIFEAINGKDAITKYKMCNPDLVLMDISMPVMDGIQAVHEIKKIDPQAQIIICSLQGQRENVMQAIKAGAKSFLVKPIREEKLVKEIHKLSIAEKSEGMDEALLAELQDLSDQTNDIVASLDYLKGIEEGYYECKREVATNMLRLGLGWDIIVNCVELSEEEIAKYKEEYHL